MGKVVTSNSIGQNTSSDNAVDGYWNRGTFHQNVCVHTKGGSPFISVDLGEEYSISSINLVGRGDKCPECEAQTQNWTIRIGNTGQDTDSICSENVDAYGGKLAPIRCNGTKISGRHVKVESETNMVMCEIQIFGTIKG